MNKKLIPYQVGENDIVLASSKEEAAQVLNDFCIEDSSWMEKYTESEAISIESKLNENIYEEDGELIGTLAEFIDGMESPRYLYGWG